MTKMELQKELLELVSALSEEKQRWLLSYAHNLAGNKRGMTIGELRKFEGFLSPETCDVIEKALEDCERIDHESWK